VSWPDEDHAALASAAGPACFVLLGAEREWVHRRVEQVDLLTTELVRREVSVDFTVPEPLRALLALPGTSQAVVPLATVRKVVLRRLDLRDEDGRAVPVLGRAHNALVAREAMAEGARRALRAAGLGPPSTRLLGDLEVIAGAELSDVDLAVDALLAARRRGDPEAAAVLADPAAGFLIGDLADHWLLLAVVEDLDRRRILKFAYDDRLDEAGDPTLAQRLGWRPLGLAVHARLAGRTASYHAELVGPEEVRFVRTVLADLEAGELFDADGEADRAAVSSSRVPRGANAQVIFQVQAERAGFPVVAFAVAATAALVLLLGAVAFDPTGRVAGPSNAVLLAASALFAGVVARWGEHRLLQSLLALPRLLLVAVALAAVVAAATLAFGAPAGTVEVVWGACAAVATALALVLGVGWRRARPRAWVVRRATTSAPAGTLDA
jgi:hypothetical protein